MFNVGALGPNPKTTNSSEALCLQTWHSPLIDISAGTPAYIVGPYSNQNAIGIFEVTYIPEVTNAGTGSAGSVKVGTPGDTDAIVTDANGAIGTTTTAGTPLTTYTMESTLRDPGIQKTGGLPVLPKGTPLVVVPTAGGSNTSDGKLVVKYWNIEPTQ